MCGIFAIMSQRSIGSMLHQGMLKLQHRGQHAAGVFVYDPETDAHLLHRTLGYVHDLFPITSPIAEQARWGIGHIRYATMGSGALQETQPQLMRHPQTLLAMVHNGNVVNYEALKSELQQTSQAIGGGSDVEVILHLFAEALTESPLCFEQICQGVLRVFERVAGAYSVVCALTQGGLVAFRDPRGIRPLFYGVQPAHHAHAFASETEALFALNISEIQSVAPGEVIFIDARHQVHRRELLHKPHAHCSFEFVYFAKSNAVMENREIYRVRSELGRLLAKRVRQAHITADLVVAVPDTARPAAIGLARELGLPLEEGLIRRTHVGRTFILPKQGEREQACTYKFEAVPCVFRDKVVLFVDDSIIRGTVSRKVVHMARNAGARAVYFCSTFPPVRHPCFYGIDFPSKSELVAHEKTLEQIANEIGADGVIYNDLQDLREAIGIEDLCQACLTGVYPVDVQRSASCEPQPHSSLCGIRSRTEALSGPI